MKKFTLVSLFIGVSIISYCQDTALSIMFPVKDNKVIFEKVDSSRLQANEIYNLVKVWIAKNFVSANNVIQHDQAPNKIIGKGIFKFNNKGGGSLGIVTVFFTIDVSIKDNKYRIRLYDFLVTNSCSSDIENPIENVHVKTYTGLMKKYFYNAELIIKNKSEEILRDLSIAINKGADDVF